MCIIMSSFIISLWFTIDRPTRPTIRVQSVTCKHTIIQVLSDAVFRCHAFALIRQVEWLLTQCISFQSHTMSQIQSTWETQHQNTAEESKDHLAAPRGSDRNTTNPTHASLQRNQGSHTFPQKHLSYRTETMVTKGMECNSWVLEVKSQLIFSIKKLVLNKNLKTFKERHSAMRLFIDGICFCWSHQPALFQHIFNKQVQQRNSWWQNNITHDSTEKYKNNQRITTSKLHQTH